MHSGAFKLIVSSAEGGGWEGGKEAASSAGRGEAVQEGGSSFWRRWRRGNAGSSQGTGNINQNAL